MLKYRSVLTRGVSTARTLAGARSFNTKVGVVTEIKSNENRVALVPAGASALAQHGHQVFVESGAGEGSGFSDADYEKAGATVLKTAADVWGECEMVMKVKEPLPQEWPHIKAHHTLFTYFHFAASRPLTEAMVESGATCVAYETVQAKNGSLPLLTPMSEVAGRMAAQEGAKYMERFFGGCGVLMGGVPGVRPAKVVVLGGGVVGVNATRVAAGMGADVKIFDSNLDRLRELDLIMPANVDTTYSNRYAVLEAIQECDLVIGAVLVTGAKAPKLILRDDLKLMKKGSVIVDVAVDQGGCTETCKATTHDDPTYVVDDVLHYSVANMPGAVPVTSTLALTNATLPYAMQIANQGWKGAASQSKEIKLGVNVAGGKIVYRGVADAFGMEYTDVNELLMQ